MKLSVAAVNLAPGEVEHLAGSKKVLRLRTKGNWRGNESQRRQKGKESVELAHVFRVDRIQILDAF